MIIKKMLKWPKFYGAGVGGGGIINSWLNKETSKVVKSQLRKKEIKGKKDSHEQVIIFKDISCAFSNYVFFYFFKRNLFF